MPITLWLIILVSMGTAWSEPIRDAASAVNPETRRFQIQTPVIRQFTVKARQYAFDPARIEVNRGDIVKITLVAEDVPHSFTIKEYRICKRVSPQKSVNVEFLADQPGTFVYYSNLTSDERSHDMRGTLVVRDRGAPSLSECIPQGALGTRSPCLAEWRPRRPER